MSIATNSTSLRAALSSQIGRKVLTAITGLALTGFVLGHMTGNLALLLSGRDAYNAYAHFLEGLGGLLYAIEALLVVFFVLHAFLGISIWLGKRRARPSAYRRYQSSGNPSKQSLSSRSMIVTGLIMLVFLVIHLLSFKFGPGGPGNADAAYLTTVAGVEMRDLAQLVIERFQSPLYTFGYVFVMVLLAIHLRHGFWSALQSLGAMTPRLTPVVYTTGAVLGLLIALGFIVLPLTIFFGGIA